MSAAQLRAIAELWIIIGFLVFNRFVLEEPIKWNHIIGFAFVVFGVYIVMLGPFTKNVFTPSEEKAKLRPVGTDGEAKSTVKSYQAHQDE